MDGIEVFDDEMLEQFEEMLGELDAQLRRENVHQRDCAWAETQGPQVAALEMGRAAAVRDANKEASRLAVRQIQVEAEAEAQAQAQAQAHQAQASAHQARENAQLAQAGAEAKALAHALTQAAPLQSLAQSPSGCRQMRAGKAAGKAAGKGAAGADAAVHSAASEAEGEEALRRATAGMQRIRQAVASQVASVLLGQSAASQSVPPQHLAGYHPFLGTLSSWPSTPYQAVLHSQPAHVVVTACPLPCLQPSAGGGCIVKAPERQPSLSSAVSSVSSAPSSPISISPSAAAATVASTNPAVAMLSTAILPALPATLATAFTSATNSATAASPHPPRAVLPTAVTQLAGDDAQCHFHQQRLEAQQKAKMQAQVALAIAQARQEAGSNLKRPHGEEGGIAAAGRFHARESCEEADLRAADLKLKHALRQTAPRPSNKVVRAWLAAGNASHSLDSFRLDAAPPGVRPVRQRLHHEQP